MKSKARQQSKSLKRPEAEDVRSNRSRALEHGSTNAPATAGHTPEAPLASALRDFRLDRHVSYTAQVEAALHRAIVRGTLLPGASLSEAAISAALGISRTPVREALALLADEQLVVIYPQVKTLVAPVRRSLIEEGRFV